MNAFYRQTPQALDAEHRAALELYGKLEQAVVAGDRGALARLAGALARHLAVETMPSPAPSTPARSHPIRSYRWRSACCGTRLRGSSAIRAIAFVGRTGTGGW